MPGDMEEPKTAENARKTNEPPHERGARRRVTQELERAEAHVVSVPNDDCMSSSAPVGSSIVLTIDQSRHET